MKKQVVIEEVTDPRLATLDRLDGNIRETAKVLGISLKTLCNRLSAYQAN